MMIIRKAEINRAASFFNTNPVVALLSPRQSGKTTFSNQIVSYIKSEAYFLDCENPRDIQRLIDPFTALVQLKGTAIIDEFQCFSKNFFVLRVLADQAQKVKYLILGSLSPYLLQQSSVTLAGWIAFMEIFGFHCEDIHQQNWKLFGYGVNC